jgi:hypothetical protein
MWQRFWKLIGGVLGSVTSVGVVAAVNATGLDLNPGPGEGINETLAAAIVVVSTWLGTVIAPKNAEKPAAVPMGGSD